MKETKCLKPKYLTRFTIVREDVTSQSRGREDICCCSGWKPACNQLDHGSEVLKEAGDVLSWQRKVGIKCRTISLLS
ncbi:hypothetical protein K1719_021957 [Acacia pycnantha]|nr:hypothetical protein K1719_021957 [Acacia pycnantha]